MHEEYSKYYVYFTYFKGDEHEGESVKSGHVLEAESDKDALKKLTKYVVSEKGGEITRIHNLQNVTGLFNVVKDSIQLESDLHTGDGQELGEFTEFQKYNVGFAVAHYLYSKK